MGCAPGRETTTRMRIVGTGIAPMTTALGTQRGHHARRRPAPELAGAGAGVVRPATRERTSARSAFASLFPGEVRKDISSVEFEQVGDSGLSLEQIGSVPLLIRGDHDAHGHAAVLAHVLTIATRPAPRSRRAARWASRADRSCGRSRGNRRSTRSRRASRSASPMGVALGRLTWHSDLRPPAWASFPGVVHPLERSARGWSAAIVLAGVVAIIPALRVGAMSPASVLEPSNGPAARPHDPRSPRSITTDRRARVEGQGNEGESSAAGARRRGCVR